MTRRARLRALAWFGAPLALEWLVERHAKLTRRYIADHPPGHQCGSGWTTKRAPESEGS